MHVIFCTFAFDFGSSKQSEKHSSKARLTKSYVVHCSLVHHRLGILAMGDEFEASNEYSGLMVVIAVPGCLLPVRDGREVPASDSRS